MGFDNAICNVRLRESFANRKIYCFRLIYAPSCKTIFAEPQIDNLYDEVPEGADRVFAVEYLPGQFDQRANSAEECIQLAFKGDRPSIRSAKVYLLSGDITDEELAEIKKYVINPVEAREASMELPETLAMKMDLPETVETIDGFIAKSREEIGRAHV